MFPLARNVFNRLALTSVRSPILLEVVKPINLVRHSSSRFPINTGVVFVPQQQAWVVERMGRFYKILEPGVNLLIPLLDTIRYVQLMKEIAIEIPKQSAVTSDNVTLSIDGVLFLRVVNAYDASYGVEDAWFAITQLAQTTMRSEIGKISLDTVFKERELLNVAIVEALNKAAQAWGITCLRYEIRDIKLPERVQEAMQMQVEAERKKRAAILESEGVREANINVAEGKKRSRVLASEAERTEQINKAQGNASAILTVANAKAVALEKVSMKLRSGSSDAASLLIAEEYVKAFSKLAKQSNTLIVPSDVGNISNMVAQALQVYQSINEKMPRPKTPEFIDDEDDLETDDDELISDSEIEPEIKNK